MFPRQSANRRPSIRFVQRLSLRYISQGTISLELFGEKKRSAPEKTIKSAVPSIHHTGGAVYPSLKLCSAVSARPKREKRRLPLFPEEGEWTGILGDTAGDDAWVVGKYYLGTER